MTAPLASRRFVTNSVCGGPPIMDINSHFHRQLQCDLEPSWHLEPSIIASLSHFLQCIGSPSLLIPLPPPLIRQHGHQQKRPGGGCNTTCARRRCRKVSPPRTSGEAAQHHPIHHRSRNGAPSRAEIGLASSDVNGVFLYVLRPNSHAHVYHARASADHCTFKISSLPSTEATSGSFSINRPMRKPN